MERQASNSEGQKQVIDDMSHVKPSTRGRVTAEGSPNPVTQRDPRVKFAASFEAAQRAQEEAAVRATQPSEEVAPMEQPQYDTPAPQPKPQPQLQADLSLLALTGRVVDDTVVGGFKFRMHTLTTRENNDAVASTAYTTDNLLRVTKLQVAVLARAIDTVNGIPLENLPLEVEGDEKLDKVQRREAIVGSWQHALSIELFNFYDVLRERSGKVFSTAVRQDELLKN